MSITAVSVGGQSVTIVPGSFEADLTLDHRATARFKVADPTATKVFKSHQPASVTELVGNGIVFDGFVDIADAHLVDTTAVAWDLTCVDNHYLSDKRLVAGTWVNETGDAILANIIATTLAAEGVTAGSIPTLPTVSQLVSPYWKASKVLDRIASLCSCWWRLAEGRKLHMVPIGTYLGSVTMTAADVRIGTAHLANENQKYRNRQWIKGGKDKAPNQVESHHGDGQTRSFTLSYQVRVMTSIKLNGTTQTVGIRGVDTGKQWYYQKGDAVVSQDSGGTPIASTDTLQVTYDGEYDLVAVSDSVGEQQAVKSAEGGNTTGYVEDVQHDSHYDGRDQAFQLAAGLLAKYGVRANRLTFTTKTPGCFPGYLLNMTLAPLGLNGQVFLIDQVHVHDEEDEVLWYDVQAITGPIAGRS